MTIHKLNGNKYTEMILSGALHLKNNAKFIDALNVFPVPDGDTGTNMNLSMTSGVDEVKIINSNSISEVANAFAKGLLMGARGNSGVILSQLFRGFSSGFEEKEEINAYELAESLHNGVKTAYKAVMKPVEGTILTVAKDVANLAQKEAETEEDIIALMEKVVKEAKESLKRTPELLPVLKEVGVVDSGGQGLVTIYEGFLASLKGEDLPNSELTPDYMDEMVNAEHHKAQDFMDTSDIIHGYCTEFMVKFEPEKLKEHPFDEATFRNELREEGDSLLVVSDEEIVKVHVHTEHPGNALTLGQRFGSLINMDIENMREQHTSIVGKQNNEEPKGKKVKYGIITVAIGSGIKELFESMGAAVVIEGGQTMNPSTLDITNAIKEVNANNVLILPNNKNIIMAAEQAAEIAEENVDVVATSSIPQGITALLAFNSEVDIDENKMIMNEAKAHVKTGQITYAVRDTKINGMTIEKGNFMGIADSYIQSSHQDKLETTKALIKELVNDDDEILTILYGKDVTESEIEKLGEFIEKEFEDIELEIYDGKQPIYSFIISVE